MDKYVKLLHDNDPSHKAAIVTKFLEDEKITVLPHPPYSPDLAPCDYCIRPNYRTVRLDFSKLLNKLVVKYQPNKGTL